MSRGTPLGGRLIKAMPATDAQMIMLMGRYAGQEDGVADLLNNQWYFGTGIPFVPHTVHGFNRSWFDLGRDVDAFSTIKNMIPRR